MSFAMPSASLSGSAAAGMRASSAEAAQHRKLTDAAQQFEGMLLQEMLKPMREHAFGQSDEDDKTEGSGFGDTLSSYGTEAVAKQIAKSGGLGIARRVVEQVEGERRTKLHDRHASPESSG